MGMVDTIRGADFQVRGLLFALSVGDATRIGPAMAREAIFLGSQGGRYVEKGRNWARLANEIAKETDDSFCKGYAQAANGFICNFSGDFHQGGLHFESAAETLVKETTGKHKKCIP